MKKILSMMVGLLTAIALLAVVAAARDDGPAAPAETTAAAEATAAPDRDGGDADGRDGGAEDGTDAGAPAEGTWEKGEWCERDEPGPEALLKELAAAGVINQDQIPAIAQWLKTQGPTLENYDDPSDLLAAAVTDGVITQTQADDIANLITQMKQAESEEGYGPDENGPECPLQELAAQGVINQDQIPAIAQWLKTQGPTLENYDDPSDLLAAAVTDGVITQTQADDIANLITQMKQAESEEGYGPDENGPECPLQELAAQGVINQDQIPAIAQWLKTQGPTLENYDDPSDLLAAAVTDGVITQTQADDIANLIAQMKQAESEEGYGPDENGPECPLQELAAQGVINQDQIPAIAQWLKTQGPTLENYDDPSDLLAAAVTDGVITQTQADDIANLIAQMKQMEGEEGCGPDEDGPEGLLQELAAAGVVDQDQIPAIAQWLKTQGPTLENYDDPSDLLAAAVADGVITQAQADDIANLINRMEQSEGRPTMSS